MRGIYFHSQKDFRHIISPGINVPDLGIENHIGPLVRPQQSSRIETGSKYYFLYNLRSKSQNWMLIGSGETVLTLQKERRGVKVPYVHYYLVRLFDFMNYKIAPSEIFQKYHYDYQDIFAKYHENENIRLEAIDISLEKQIPHISGTEANNCDGLLDFYDQRNKVPLIFNSIGEAMQIYDCLIERAPTILKWQYSIIVTPVEGDYQEKIVLVYGQLPKREKTDYPSTPSSKVASLLEKNQDSLNKFWAFYGPEIKHDTHEAYFNNSELDDITKKVNTFIEELSKGNETPRYLQIGPRSINSAQEKQANIQRENNNYWSENNAAVPHWLNPQSSEDDILGFMQIGKTWLKKQIDEADNIHGGFEPTIGYLKKIIPILNKLEQSKDRSHTVVKEASEVLDSELMSIEDLVRRGKLKFDYSTEQESIKNDFRRMTKSIRDIKGKYEHYRSMLSSGPFYFSIQNIVIIAAAMAEVRKAEIEQEYKKQKEATRQMYNDLNVATD